MPDQTETDAAQVLPERLVTDPAFLAACASRDIGAVFRLVRKYAGFGTTRIGRLCDLHPTRVGEYMTGKRKVHSQDVIERVADGLRISGALLGLAARPWETPAPSPPPDPQPTPPGIPSARRRSEPAPGNAALRTARHARQRTQQELADAVAAWLEQRDGAEAAGKAANDAPLVAASALLQEAHGYAMLGDATSVQRKIERAHTTLDRPDNSGTDLGSYCSRQCIEVQRALCWMRLGDPRKATAAFATALDDWPGEYRREQGVYLAHRAMAEVAAGNHDTAAHNGRQALRIAKATGSHRTITELRTLAGKLAKVDDIEPVTKFLETFRETTSSRINKQGAS